MRAALVNKANGLVTNVIEIPDDYDSTAENAYSPPPDHTLQIKDADKAMVGGTFKNGVFAGPTLPPVAEVPPTVQEQLDALAAALVAKGTLTQAQVAATKAPRP